MISSGLGLGLAEGICQDDEDLSDCAQLVNGWLGGTVSFSRSTQHLSCCVTALFFTCEFELHVYGFMVFAYC